MSIIRLSKKESKFAQIDNRLINDKRLSWRARGILCYLISKPENWTIVTAHLIEQGPEGRDAVRTCFNELKELGYARMEHKQDSDGKMMGNNWIISEEPELSNITETGCLKNRMPEKPDAGKSPPTNTDITNTESESNTDSVVSDQPSQQIESNSVREDTAYNFDAFWSEYPKKEAKKEALKKWKKLKASDILLIASALQWQIKSHKWLEGYAPNPTTYLNQERWNDMPEENRSAQSRQPAEVKLPFKSW